MESYVIHGIRNDGKEVIVNLTLGDIDEAANLLTDIVFLELGDGDGENGGKGSLKNCEPEIWLALYNFETYEYADCKFWIEKKKNT